MSGTFRAFADEMTKIAISDYYFGVKALNAIRKSPTSKVPAQIARALLTANRKGFKESTHRLEDAFKDWKLYGKHPKAPPEGEELKKILKRRAGEAKKNSSPKPSSPSSPSPSAPKSWKKKALFGAAAVSVPAAAYGVHKFNKKQLSED